MVVIECPHCDEDIEMDDDAHGLFACPYCDNEYEWGDKPKPKVDKRRKFTESKYKSSVKKKSDPAGRKKLNFSSSVSKQKVLTNDDKLFGGLQLTVFFSTIVMLIIIILGLNSSSWYYADYGGDDDDGLSEVMMHFSLDELRYVLVWGDQGYGGEEGEKSISVADYDSQLLSLESYQVEKEEYCDDYFENGNSAEDEDDFNRQCSEAKRQIQDGIDWWSGWNAAGSAIKIFFISGLLVCILVLSIKMLGLLNDYSLVSLPPKIVNNYYKINSIASLLMVSLILFGCLLFRLLIPDFDSSPISIDPDSKGLSQIWWFTIVSVTSYAILLLTELVLRKRSA